MQTQTPAPITYAQIEAARRRWQAAGHAVTRAAIDVRELNPDDPDGEPVWRIDDAKLFLSTRDLLSQAPAEQPRPTPPAIRMRPAVAVPKPTNGAGRTLAEIFSQQAQAPAVAPAPETDIKQLPLSQIRRDGGTQPRAALDDETLADYTEAMKSGAQFPPVVVFYDGAAYWLADGFHRVNAAINAVLTTISAQVIPGSQRDAILYSIGANATHGLRRTGADKRRAVERLLLDDEWAKWSDRVIAQRCGVTHPFVSKVRSELTGNRYQSENAATISTSTQRMGADGRSINTEHIGRAPAQPAEPEMAPIWQLEMAVRDWASHAFPDLEQRLAVLESLKRDKTNAAAWNSLATSVRQSHRRGDLLQAINNVTDHTRSRRLAELAGGVTTGYQGDLIAGIRKWLEVAHSDADPIGLLQGLLARETDAQRADWKSLIGSRFVPPATPDERLAAVLAVLQELQAAAPAPGPAAAQPLRIVPGAFKDTTSTPAPPAPAADPPAELRPATVTEVSQLIAHIQETADIFFMDRTWLTDYAASVGKRQGLLVTPDQVNQEFEDLLVEAQFARSRPVAALISQDRENLRAEIQSRPITPVLIADPPALVSDLRSPITSPAGKSNLQPPAADLQSAILNLQFPHTIDPVTILCADARAAVTTVTAPVHLVITSPPYNTGGVIAYDGHADNLDQDAYDNLLEDVWRRCAEVLAPGGRLCINVPFGMGRSPWTPVTPAIYRQLASAGLDIEGQIVWDKGTSGNSTAWGSWGRPSNPVLRDTCEAIIIAAKAGESAMPRDILVPAGPAQLVSPWLREEGLFMQLTQDHWQVAPESATRVGHPAPFPVKLAENLVRLYGWPGCHVLDPFAGSGTTALAVVGLPGGDRCQVTLIEQSPVYCQLAAGRLAQRLAQPTLKGIVS